MQAGFEEPAEKITIERKQLDEVYESLRKTCKNPN